VLASVAAILLLMWPDFPIPVTTMRPGVSRHNWQAATKLSSSQGFDRAGLDFEHLGGQGDKLVGCQLERHLRPRSLIISAF